MTKHIIIEVVLVAVILGGAGWYFHQQSLEAAKVQAKVEGRAEQQKQDDATLEKINADREAEHSRYLSLQDALQKATSKQIVSKAPEFVSGIPISSRPIVIWQPGLEPPKEGDAIVPADQIKPIAAQILAGNNCMVNDLPACVKERDIWTHKYTLRDQDARDWEKLAKGGGMGRKLKRCGILGAVGFGMGAGMTSALPVPVGQSKPVLRNGAIVGGAEMLTCWFLK